MVVRQLPPALYVVDASCFTPENLARVVHLEPWDELPVDVRWTSYRDYDDADAATRERAVIVVDVPFGAHGASAWLDLGDCVMRAENLPSAARVEAETEVFRERLAACGIRVEVRPAGPENPPKSRPPEGLDESVVT